MSPTHRIETFSTKPLIGRRQWRWRCVRIKGGKKVCGSLEGYNNYGDMEHEIYMLKDGFSIAEIREVDQ